MPLPLIAALLAGAAAGKAAAKKEEKTPVNGRLKNDGTRAKAHLRKKKAR
jgi:hypothetical protein